MARACTKSMGRKRLEGAAINESSAPSEAEQSACGLDRTSRTPWHSALLRQRTGRALRPPVVRIHAAFPLRARRFAGSPDARLRRSPRLYDLDGLRKYTAAARFPPRLASRSLLL